MRSCVYILIGAWLLAWAVAPAPALLTSAELNDKRVLQERARDMARELITGILDVQIDKLEVNGMKDRPLYGEIVSMRKNIDGLVESDMREVVDMLAQARVAPEADREKTYAAVREKTRHIIDRLSTERQNMFRRVRVAQLAEQMQRLLKLQKDVLSQTRDLTADKTAGTLRTAQDQRDVQTLTSQLTKTLSEVDTWGGIDGATASDALRILKAADIDREIAKAVSALETAAFPEAVASQQLALNTFRMVLEKIQAGQGALARANDEVLREVQRVINAQEDVRDRTRVANLKGQSAVALLQNQSDIYQRMDKLVAPLDRVPEAASLLQQAKGASLEANSQLFAAEKDKAMGEQAKVVGNLKAIIQNMQQASVAGIARSADEWAVIVTELKQARDAAVALVVRHEAAQRGAPGDAVAPLQQIAAELDKLAQNRKLPGVVQSRATAAREAASRAAAAPASLDGSRNAVDRLSSEIQAALVDAQRKYLAVKIGELNRASEALERTAAVETLIARRAAEAGEAEGLAPVMAKTLELQQGEVSNIALKTADAIRNTAPEASKSVLTAKEPIQAAAAQFAQAKQTPQISKAAAQQADEVTRRLTEAARLVRLEIIAAAEQLAKLAGERAREIATVIADVDTLRTSLPTARPLDLGALRGAEEKIAEAQIAFARSTGNESVADALYVLSRIDQADEYQADAGELADEAALSITSLTPEIANTQQRVVDALTAAATKASGPLAEALKDAAQAAADVAKATVQGNPAAAEAARTNAVQAIEKVRTAAAANVQTAKAAGPTAAPAPAATRAAQKPPVLATPSGPSDSTMAPPDQAQESSSASPEEASDQAQESSSASSEEASDQAQNSPGATPRASARPPRAGSKAAKPQTAKAAGPRGARPPAAANTPQELIKEAAELAAPITALDPSGTPEQAEQKLQSASTAAAKEQSQKLAVAAPKMAALAPRAGAIAPEAGAKMSSVQKAATKQGKSDAGQPKQTARTEEAVERDLDDVVASLTEKLREAEQDGKLASDIAKMAATQQLDRDQVEKDNLALVKASAAAKPPKKSGAPAGKDGKSGEKTTPAAKADPSAKAGKAVDKSAPKVKPDTGEAFDMPAQTEANPTKARSETDGERAHGKRSDPAEPSNPLKGMAQAASTLKHSSKKFAMKNKQIGKNAEDLAKQADIVNSPLLVAMKKAAELSQAAKDLAELPLEEEDAGEAPMSAMDVAMGDADQKQDESPPDDANAPAPDTDETGSGGAGGKGNTSPGETKAPKSPKNPKPGGPDKGLGSDTGSGAPGSGSGGKGEGSGDPSTQSSAEPSSGTPGSTPAPGKGNAMKSSSGMTAPPGRKPRGGSLPKPPDTGMTPSDPDLTAEAMSGSGTSDSDSGGASEGGDESSSDPSDSSDDSASADSADSASADSADSASADSAGSSSGKAGGPSSDKPGGDSSKSSKPGEKGGGGGGKSDTNKLNKAVGMGAAPKPGGKAKPGDTNAVHDATVKTASYEGEPWFTKLPPDVRAAIAGTAQRRAPAGYEELLDRYFEDK